MQIVKGIQGQAHAFITVLCHFLSSPVSQGLKNLGVGFRNEESEPA